MRGLIMSHRSVYWQLTCERCGKKVKQGEPFLGTTLFVDTDRIVRHFELGAVEFEVRLIWHRRCMDIILQNAPVDPDSPVTISRFERYRERLLEQLQNSDE